MTPECSSPTSSFLSWYQRESATPAYDAFTRLPALSYFGYGLWCQIRAFAAIAPPGDGQSLKLYASTLLAHLATLLVFFAFAALTLVRSRPAARSEGLPPRLAAILGAAIPVSFVFLQRAPAVLEWELASATLIALSGIFTSRVVWHLGRSFSTMPEARQLVTSGPYRFVRHPLYVTEEIAVIGVAIQYRSLAALLLVVVQLGFQFARMNYEEKVLANAFPEYKSYSERTARLIPGLI
jgi:protein-S-isoprenylcysteine O-methyltransferase Ste14